MTAQDDVAKRVRAIVGEQLDRPIEDIRDDASFLDDLGADSLSLVEIILAVEEAFDVYIRDEDVERVRTVGEAVAWVEGRLRPGKPSPPSPRAPYTEHDALRDAVWVAGFSRCIKSQRGVVVFRRDSGRLTVGSNFQPPPFNCDGSETCREACNRLCLHAETVALTNLDVDAIGRKGLEMLHVETVDGKAVPSGEPSCWQCSRMIAWIGIERMWLLHDDGLRSYTADEFHELTLRHCGLPVLKGDWPP